MIAPIQRQGNGCIVVRGDREAKGDVGLWIGKGVPDRGVF